MTTKDKDMSEQSNELFTPDSAREFVDDFGEHVLAVAYPDELASIMNAARAPLLARIAELEAKLEAAEKDADEKMKEAIEWLDIEISAVDCRYRGDPSYDHDAYWFKERALKLVEEAGNIFTKKDAAIRENE